MQEKKKKILTGNFGPPVDDDQNTMTAGSSGPAMLQDTSCGKASSL
jgi:catalase